jgi:hypothetical protein
MAQQRQHGDLASVMYPALSREAKAREAAQQRHQTDCQQRKAMLLADLRELRQRIDQRLQREREGRR